VDCNHDSYRDTLQEAGIAITPYSRDRWFPATYANFSHLKNIMQDRFSIHNSVLSSYAALRPGILKQHS